ncbi:MAG: cofactor-independent phosphoglycerate mutase [Archaeoglobi archaeon]|nr:cofactor-independent phosphoglycerate mutase [Candidatus Mnemosynella bozhongmuii]
MKYLIFIPDGMADRPLRELDGRTPLQVAETPNMDRMAREGACGLTENVPRDMEPGSEIATLSILGYDPRKYYTGRGPLEAGGMGIELNSDEVAYRCNLVTVKDGIMVDYSAGHISTEEARILIEALNERLNGEARFLPGVSYRNLLLLSGYSERVSCTPPHNIMGEEIEKHLPIGDERTVRKLRELIFLASEILAKHEINEERIRRGERPANMIWPWGQGRRPEMPEMSVKYGLRGCVISAVDLIRGLGKYAGLKIVDVPGATGYIDTNYEGKAESAMKCLEKNDFVLLHVEAPDEASHEGSIEKKIYAIERVDEMLGRILEFEGELRILLTPDHATPIKLRTHCHDPVPFVIWGEGVHQDDVQRYDEISAKDGAYGMRNGLELMSLLLGETR